MNQSRYSTTNENAQDVGSAAIINAYDLAAIEELDPILADGFKAIFDREIPIELRFYRFHLNNFLGWKIQI